MRRLWKNQKGATAIEYALIAALIGIAAMTGMQTVGGSLNTKLSNMGSCIAGAGHGLTALC